jgi:hypothetical protein
VRGPAKARSSSRRGLQFVSSSCGVLREHAALTSRHGPGKLPKLPLLPVRFVLRAGENK